MDARVSGGSAPRRRFVRSLLTAPALISGMFVPANRGVAGLYASGQRTGGTQERRRRVYEVRRDTARFERDQPLRQSVANNDERLYSGANYIANYTKGLPHNT